jgi:hypothetical protein
MAKSRTTNGGMTQSNVNGIRKSYEAFAKNRRSAGSDAPRLKNPNSNSSSITSGRKTR